MDKDKEGDAGAPIGLPSADERAGSLAMGRAALGLSPAPGIYARVPSSVGQTFAHIQARWAAAGRAVHAPRAVGSEHAARHAHAQIARTFSCGCG